LGAFEFATLIQHLLFERARLLRERQALGFDALTRGGQFLKRGFQVGFRGVGNDGDVRRRSRNHHGETEEDGKYLHWIATGRLTKAAGRELL
jgi:hypothetical protein